MDDSTDIFSAEALRLLGSNQSSLDAQALYFLDSWDTSNADHFGGIPGTAPEAPPAQYNVPRSQHRADTWYSTFLISTDQEPKHKRAKFEDPNRRAEVARVRKEGACMRCRWNKIPCSSARPCRSCISCWVSFDSRSSKLRWMGCVPFSWNNVNIYAHDFSHEDYEAILHSCSVLMEEHTELHFGELIPWDINALSIDFAIWMAADNVHPTATSRVGILSSMECQRLLHNYLDVEICTNLRLLVKVSSLLYSRKDFPHPIYSCEHLNLIRFSVGTELMKSLETALKATALANASNEKLKGLFLVLLGIIIATTYTTTTDSEEARHELIQILAHHMIFVGERIGLLNCDLTKQRLTKNCHNIWNKTGNFEWSYEIPPATEGIDRVASLRQSQDCLGLSPATSLSLDSPRVSVPEENDHQLGSTTSIAWAGDILPQIDPIPNGGPQSAVGASQTYDWLGDSGTEHSSFSTFMGTTNCFLCNRSFPSNEMCPVCFGPVPLMAGYGDVALQGAFGSTSPVPDPRVSDLMAINTEAVPVYGCPESVQSDTRAISSSLHRSEASSGNLQKPRYSFRPRSPTGENFPDVEDKSDRSKTRPEGTKRKPLDQCKKAAEKKMVKVQKSPKHTRKTPGHPRKEPPLVSQHDICINCDRPFVSRAADIQSQCNSCHHLKCSGCELYHQVQGYWFCCNCGFLTSWYNVPSTSSSAQSRICTCGSKYSRTALV